MIIVESNKKIKGIKPVTVIGLNTVLLRSTDFLQGENNDLMIKCIAENIYISTLTTAITTTNSWMLSSSNIFDLKVESFLTIMGDSTSSSYQAVVWDR